MALSPGMRLGPYEILSALGAGGMGEVYRARDPRLDRQVAIKLLPSGTAADPGARERLRREALAAAALDHPYICKIFEMGEDDAALFLVMEYIAGTTLHRRLLEGRMPLPEALRVAGEIAEALQEAHAGGLLHRDLKPANIMLTQQGHVKVMDFGLAKRVEEPPSPDAATREMAGQLTAHGAIVGTPDYMSPEQVKGARLDVRSDLFSFGVILAEMTGGRHPFRKSSTVETFSAVLSESPALNGDLPQGVMVLLRRLLAKDVEARYASITDVRADLAKLSAAYGSGAGVEVAPTAAPSTRRRPSRGAIVAVAAAAMIVIGMTVWVTRRGAPPGGGPAGVLTPARVSSTGGINVEPALSPDGSSVAFASDRSGAFEIYIVGLARGSKEIAITSDGQNSVQPAWSPDGRWIAYAHNHGGGLWLVPSTGGTPRQLVESGSNPVWSPDSNWIVFTTQTGVIGQSSLKVIGRDGGGLRDLTQLGAPVGGHRSPAWSTSGRFIAFATVRGADEASVWIVDAAGGAPRRLQTIAGVSNLQFGTNDRALFFSGSAGALYRLALDPVQGTATGRAAEIILSVPGEFDGISIARDGLLAYGLTTNDTNLWTIDLAPGGEAREPARLTDDTAGRTTRPDYSPDGRRLTYSQSDSGGQAVPWVMNADGSGRSPLITEGGGAGSTSWAPDGTRVLVQRDTSGARTMWWVDLATRRLTPVDLVKNARIPRLSPDGREIAYWMIEPNGSTNTFTQALEGGSPRRVTADAESINYPAWSPDGQWLAVGIKRGKDTHVGVVSKHGGPVEQITHESGLSGVHSWSPDGDQIAFAGLRNGVWNVWAVSRRTRVSRQLTHFGAPGDSVLYPAWSPDGRRIAFERGIRRGSVWTVQVQ